MLKHGPNIATRANPKTSSIILGQRHRDDYTNRLTPMQIDQLRHFLDSRSAAEEYLRGLGLENLERAHHNLLSIAGSGMTLDLLANLGDLLALHLPSCSDPDMALNNLERYVTASRNPLALGALFERDPESLEILANIFSTSQHLSDLLILDPESYDLVRMTQGQPVARDILVDELQAELATATDPRDVMTILRRYKRRETLRICYGDLIREQRLETVARQISFLADAIVEGAVDWARRNHESKRGIPRQADGTPARFVVLGMGKLGGTELNYSSDIDLIFLYDFDGATDGKRPQSNGEFFAALARDIVKLLTEPTDMGVAYRVDLRLRPEGSRGTIVTSQEQALQYYDVMGRTWERQAYVKARPVAGNLDFGREFLARLEPWIYRRYLTVADISGIKALKRRIEQRSIRDGADLLNVKTGHGGLRDIEFAIQFLQLLNGSDLESMHTGNTLSAIMELEKVGCLTHQERSLLDQNYCFLRKIEHRLQIMFDLQTHLLPSEARERGKLAIRMGYEDSPKCTALAAFDDEYHRVTAENRKILNHLLHDAFDDDAETEPAVDLVLDPAPGAEQIERVLAPYGFQDISRAYDNLMALSIESIRFLSTRRCRHFLASIAPQLLEAISATPDPDATLVNLAKVSESLGGKGVLWELFSFNPPTLHLYVELCASSPYLSGILTSNPGMIDELMDSLVLNKLPTLATLRKALAELCRAAEDLDPILHSFKNAQHLHVGVRDVLGKADIEDATRTLSDVAETCLEQITLREYTKLTEKMGEPIAGDGPRQGEIAELVIVGMGKFGGRELNYYSDLDVVFLYDAEGSTRPRKRKGTTTSNQHFFSELSQRVIREMTHLGPHGRLYEVDARLRPTGRSGALAVSFEGFAKYFDDGGAQLWERQALCKARIVYGGEASTASANEIIASAAFGPPWQAADAAAIRQMRERLEETAGKNNIKRGRGGLVDIEFVTQTLQLKHGKSDPTLRVPGTLAALAALHETGVLGDQDYEFFTASYRFLRTIEARLQLLNTTARNELPEERLELEKLARTINQTHTDKLLSDCRRFLEQNRERFDALFATEAAS